MSGSKLVQKGWGFEIHIANNPEYCLKYLVFFEGKRFSFHYHTEKLELWHVLLGDFDCILEDNEKKLRFGKGDKMEIKRGVPHELIARKNSIIIEVSTRDYPEDSYRIRKGD
jgi:mannose-6-phosphate isomerase-like protein (cupin superfamily)